MRAWNEQLINTKELPEAIEKWGFQLFEYWLFTFSTKEKKKKTLPGLHYKLEINRFRNSVWIDLIKPKRVREKIFSNQMHLENVVNRVNLRHKILKYVKGAHEIPF